MKPAIERGGGEAKPIAALETLLDTEMQAIRRADFSGIARFAERKEALLSALTSAPAPAPEALERLRRKARRNASALEAVGQGLRAAARRLGELAGAATPETYDAEGRRTGLGPSATRLEHRA